MKTRVKRTLKEEQKQEILEKKEERKRKKYKNQTKKAFRETKKNAIKKLTTEQLIDQKKIIELRLSSIPKEEIEEATRKINELEEAYKPTLFIPIDATQDYSEEKLKHLKFINTLIDEIEALKIDRKISGYHDKDVYVPSIISLSHKYKLLPQQIGNIWQKRESFRNKAEAVFTELKTEIKALAFDQNILIMKEIRRRLTSDQINDMSTKELRETLKTLNNVITDLTPKQTSDNDSKSKSIPIDLGSIPEDVEFEVIE